jgi:hypothetical protein
VAIYIVINGRQQGNKRIIRGIVRRAGSHTFSKTTAQGEEEVTIEVRTKCVGMARTLTMSDHRNTFLATIIYD